MTTHYATWDHDHRPALACGEPTSLLVQLTRDQAQVTCEGCKG